MKALFSEIRGAVMSTLILAVVCCGLYPLIVFAVAQTAFRDQANGSLLVDAKGVVREDRWPRLAASYHGSGCTLAAALAARLALGDKVPEAARAAQEFTWRALEQGFRPGSGQHLPRR